MTLLFTSLFSVAAMAAPPEPAFVRTINLLYRFTASEGVHKDDVATFAIEDWLAAGYGLCCLSGWLRTV